MKCLYCGKRLALLRKLSDSEFCSDMHRRLFHQEHEKMALSRLMDAQKRFETLTGAGAEPKNGKNGKNGKANAASAAPPPQEEMKGFLPYGPVTQSLRSIRQLTFPHSRQMVEPFLPELHLRVQAFPQTAGAVEIPIAQPCPVVSARPAASFDAFAAEPRAELPTWNSQPASASLAGAGEQVWIWEHPASLEPLPREIASGPDLAPLPPALPVHGFEPVLRFPEGALETEPAIEVQILEPATPVLPVESAPGFSSPISKAFPRGLLEPVETSIMGVEEVLSFEEDPAPAPMASRLLPVHKPGAAEQKRGMRRVRSREVFFPLPRLGDLPALASRVAQSAIPETMLFGAGAGWKPGPASLPFPATPVDCRAGCGVAAFVSIPAPISEMQVLPRLLGIPTVSARLPEGEAVEVVSAPAATTAQLAPLSTNALARLDMATPVEKPRIAGLPPASSLVFHEQPERLIIEPVAGIASGRGRGVVPAALNTADHVVTPEFPSGAVFHPPANLQAGRTMVQVALFEKGAIPGFIRCGAETPAETSAPRTILPASRFAGVAQPALSRQVLPIPSHTPAAQAKSALANQNVAPLWPDPARIMPRIEAGIAEDHDVQDAVRAINVVLGERRKPWTRIPSFAIPISRPDLKWFVMSVPVLLLLTVYSLTNSQETAPLASAVPQAEPETPVAEAAPPAPRRARSASPKASAPPSLTAHAPEVAVAPPGAGPFSGGLDGLKQSILRRAAISLSDDFRSGLGEWEGRGDWSKQWSYDPAGFLVTGPLALYRPSMNLSDYRMEFLGQIEKKSLGWVYRAADTENYYATKITLTTGGPLPQAIIERYAVVNGSQSSYHRRALPLQIHSDTLYRVRMEVRGNGFTLLVQGQVVDYWSDDRLKTGGIGFFSAKGEQARLRWVEVSHQYDFLGRLCAFLAPYSLPAKDGSLKQ